MQSHSGTGDLRNSMGRCAMLLAADIGNSSIDLGFFHPDGKLAGKAKLSSATARCADEYAVILNGILSLHQLSAADITDCIISSVVPSLTAAVRASFIRLFGVTPLEVGAGIKTGLNIRIDDQTQLGADIVANAVAALSLFPAPLVIVDIGSATTFAVIDEKRTLEGVIIAPGIRMSLDALSADAAELPDVSVAPPKSFIAKNTQDSMNSGVLYGHAFMIDGFVRRISQELGAGSLCTVATGGLAGTVLPFCQEKPEYCPDLTLTGLELIHRKNRK